MRTNVTIGSFVPGKETAWERNVPVPCVLYCTSAPHCSAAPARPHRRTLAPPPPPPAAAMPLL